VSSWRFSVAFTRFDDAEGMERMKEWMGPGVVDQTLRQTIHFAWLSLPPEKRNVEEVEKVMRHLLERALKDLREDKDLFGIGG
jgi:hypothetical protein